MEVEGSFNCSCYPGYELQDDGATCEGKHFHSSEKMFLHIWYMYQTSMVYALLPIGSTLLHYITIRWSLSCSYVSA